MSEIPEDIMKTAYKAGSEIRYVLASAELIGHDTEVDTIISKVILAERERSMGEWKLIDSAPKDGTIIDLWHEEFGRQPDCYWGKPHHSCGEYGKYCDSDWHGEPEGWVDSACNSLSPFQNEFTHWMHLPAAPAKQEV